MSLSSAAANAVLADYEQRAIKEAAEIAATGPEVYARRDEFLLPVGAEVGQFLHALILARRPRRVLELGTSYGYSALYLADAAKQVGGRVITVDYADYKQAYARAALERAGLADVVEFRLGDAIEIINGDPGPFDFVLLDIWKDLYLSCLEAFHPKLSEEAIVAADNMIEPAGVRDNARAYRAAVAALPDLETALLPIGNGMELSVKWSAGNGKL